MTDFLLEIGCEEIPARMLAAAERELATRVRELCLRHRLDASAEPDGARQQSAAVAQFSTPRRIAVFLSGLRARQQDVEEQVQGPATKAAFKDGQPTPAAEAFARKCGVPVSRLQRVQTPKGEYLAARVIKKGSPAGALLAELLPKEISSLYWPKSMYWRAGAPERFVRPIRWLVALLDEEVVPLQFAGVQAGNASHGHRSRSGAVPIASPAAYKKSLEKAGVLVDAAERRQRIRQQLDAAVAKIPGARWRQDDALLETVVNLTEWPAAILGNFDAEFLALPEEVLVTVMRDHQKYFAVEGANGKLLPHFLAVLNTPGAPEPLIRHGHERVLRARFNDARFFWQADQRIPLRQRIDLLKSVTFHKELGSYYEKTRRVERLARWLAEELSDSADISAEATAEAAWLAKTDLTTELVKEFTELQGIIGGLYARAQELDSAVAAAIYDHYQPESTDDAAPTTLEGAVLAIADKADTIAGMFALGRQPTGSKDPFALRRQANGIVRIIAERHLRLGLRRLFLEAREIFRRQGIEFPAGDARSEEQLGAFFRERLEFYLRAARGFPYDAVNAVLAAGSDRIADALDRVQAIAQVRPTADFQAIAAAFKRIKNILRQAQEKNFVIAPAFDPGLAREPAEQALASKFEENREELRAAAAAGDYTRVLLWLSSLRPQVDTFFDKVMVMVEDTALRANRLALLDSFYRDFSAIADFSEIVTEGPGG